MHANPAAIARVLSNGPRGLDGHDRNGLAAVVKRKIVLAGKGSFYGDSFTHPHGANDIQIFIFEAMLPDAFFNEAIRLIGLAT
jgi:hypothetical protein